MITIDFDAVKKSRFLQKELKSTKKWADMWLKEPIPPILLSEITAFSKTGARTPSETPYFNRRWRLAVYAILSIFDYGQIYFDALEDIIWAICEETTWAVPAHYDFNAKDLPIENFQHIIDLFAAETGFALAEIYALLKDRLSERIKQRIRSYVRERIIYSYLHKPVPFWWERADNNWAAVCGGSVGGAFLQFGTETEIKEALAQLLETMDCYLSGFGEDGACTEGLMYWNYGFGYFTYFADLLRQRTKGEIDLFKDEKVKNIAHFHQKTFLVDNYTASFSDSEPKSGYFFGLMNYLYTEYDDIELPPTAHAATLCDDHCFRFAPILRQYAWYNPAAKPGRQKKTAYYHLPDAQWYINKKPPFALAAKGGHNAESHNHNDIGSFTIFKGKENPLCDLGVGFYSQQYFHADTRYGFLCNSSAGHSVPIINGTLQKEGKAFCGSILSQDETHFAVDIAAAYPLPELKTLVRRIEIGKRAITIRDTYSFSKQPDSIIERFITQLKPVQSGNTIQLGQSVLRFGDDVSYTVSRDIHTYHDGTTSTVYLMDFTLKNPSGTTTVVFVLT